MQLIQKYTIVLSGLTVFLFLGYIAIQHPDSSKTGQENVLATGSVNPMSQSGIETDTGKRLETPANSGTSWGMNPFGSGKPLEEEKKLEFKKPNTEWKTRTLSGITYVFGEGNPKEVAMSKDQINAMTKPCQNDMSLIEKGICDVEAGLMSYVTPEVEKHLLLALSDPNWSKLATECENNFRARESYLTPENIAQMLTVDSNFLYFDRVVSPGFLDIDRFISIEPTTGLKVLNTNLTINLAQFIQSGMYAGAGRGEPQPNPYGDCVDRYGKNIYMNLRATAILYTRPLMDAEGIIHEIFTNH